MTHSRAFTRLDWYDEPHYYDILLQEDTPIEATFLEAVVARHGRARSRDLLELACGSGRLVVELARRGYRLTGLDLSRPMLDYAAQQLAENGLEAELINAPMQRFRTRRRFDAAYNLVSSFRYLLDEETALGHLDCVARSLRKGGLYVLGLHLTQYDWDRLQRERWVGAREGIEVVCNLQSWPPDRRKRRERLRSRLTVRSKTHDERIETHWEFRTYDASQLKRLLRKVPGLEHVTTYDFTYDLASERVLDDEQQDSVLVLRKG